MRYQQRKWSISLSVRRQDVKVLRVLLWWEGAYFLPLAGLLSKHCTNFTVGEEVLIYMLLKCLTALNMLDHGSVGGPFTPSHIEKIFTDWGTWADIRQQDWDVPENIHYKIITTMGLEGVHLFKRSRWMVWKL